MTLPLIGALVSGLGGMFAANQAASAQRRAANQQMALARETRDLTRADLAPWRDTGMQANSALNYLAGFGDAPEGWRGFEGFPGLDFRLDTGRSAIEGSAAARGGLLGGRTARALTQYGQNLGSQEFGNYLSLLTGLSGMGQNAAAGTAAAGQNYGMMASNALADRGNATAAGWTQMGNVLSDTMGNLTGAWQYQQGLNAARPGANDPAFGSFMSNWSF